MIRLDRFFLGLLWLCTACTPTPIPTFNPTLHQTWELQPGDQVANYPIIGGLGDISVALKGGKLYAPFDGNTAIDRRGCVYFNTPEVPSYQFRLCGVQSPQLGFLRQGSAIGTAEILQFATLRKQPDGTWAIVEPTKQILERTLKTR